MTSQKRPTNSGVLADRRLRAVLEYFLVHGSTHSTGVPKTKLFKLIYLADFGNYYFNGQPLTHQVYKNRTYGPVPDSLFYLVDQMVDGGDLVVDSGNKASFHRLLVKPSYASVLSAKEIALLKRIADTWKSRPTEEIVKFTHDQRPWALTKADEDIPYSLILQEGHPFDPEKVRS